MSSPAPSTGAPAKRSRLLLDPIDRTSEILFGLIMVLTFTGSLSVAEAGSREIRTMLIGAIGCNLAWGLVDAIMYLITSMTERKRGMVTLLNVRRARDASSAHRIIAGALPAVVSSVMRPEQLETIRQQLSELPEPARPRLRKRDWLAAFAVFLWVFLTTFPVVIPFLVMHNAAVALRVSNGVAIVLFFLAGFWLGRAAAIGAWRMGLSMVAVGLVLVGITIALGG